ncbi:hypothetical protein PSHT_13291, partial [Puccinia striiformis]
IEMFFLGSRWIRDANALAALSILVIISTTLPPTNAQISLQVILLQALSAPAFLGAPQVHQATPFLPQTRQVQVQLVVTSHPFSSPGSTTSSPTFPTPDPTTSSPPSPIPSATSTQTPNQTAPATKSATSGSGFAAPESLKPEIIGGIVTGSFIGALFLIIGFLFVFTHYLRPSVPKKDKGKGVDKDNSNTTPTQPAENPRDSPC